MSIPSYKVALIRERACSIERTPVQTPEEAVPILRTYLADADREMFAAIALNTRLRPIGLYTVSIGTLDRSFVHPREAFKAAILMNAASIILAHNHPSGDPEPSVEDCTVTYRIAQAGKLLGIEVLDHVILGEGESYVSLKRRGKLESVCVHLCTRCGEVCDV